MRIALAQINTAVGDLKGNLEKMISSIDKAKKEGCELVVFPELCLPGYPPRDLLFRDEFNEACRHVLSRLLPYSRGIGVLVGMAVPVSGSEKGCDLAAQVDNTCEKKQAGRKKYNSAILLDDGCITGKADKSRLSLYDSIDDSRYFEPAREVKCLNFRGLKIGVTISGDILNDEECLTGGTNEQDVLAELYSESPDLFINISASPYHFGRQNLRETMLMNKARKYSVPLLYVNLIGGNDELIFDGSSMAIDKAGNPVLRAKSFDEDMVVFDTYMEYAPLTPVIEDISWMYNALVLGVRDYFRKVGAKKALLGLSGGIDSALVACIAVEALGKENVLGVSNPSRYTSRHSRDEARVLAENLGMEYREIPIEDIFKEYIKIFNGSDETKGDLAEENIQARIRGSLWMFLSNREGRMLINSSNKSELAVGYTTLYGDMCGALSVIGDVYKTSVYDLCRYINREREIIPENTITKPPSAELRPDQTDQDSLPPYHILDAVIRMLTEENNTLEEMVEKGYDRDTVVQILNMIDRVEFKRRQAPPILKLTGRASGIGRKIPIVQGFRWK